MTIQFETTGDKIQKWLQNHEGVAFSMTQLSKQFGVSRVSIRKHIKRMATTTSEKFHIGKDPNSGTGFITWFGAEAYDKLSP